MTKIFNKKKSLLTLAALGVVYGDIGTSPLYALRECFYGEHGIPLNSDNIFGILSLIFWSLVLIISLKYLLFIMRADNQGEGGILALMQLVLPNEKSKKKFKRHLILIIGLFGAALLYGDGVLTPAISVLSAVEGLEIVTPGLASYVVPITIAILLGLFLLQSRGTEGVGKLFGPIMLVWFTTLGVLGILQILQFPSILTALNPYHAIHFLIVQGKASLFVLGAVFLVVTGGEALYADMGHFGLGPIRKAWFTVVLPGLLLNYFGQGVLLMQHPEFVKNPFYYLIPTWGLVPLIILAMMATIIASQAIISGAFSLTFQAVQLGYLPRLRILHTSKTLSGQVYLPRVNFILLIATIITVIMFQSSSNLSVAYGIAITVTMVITDILAFYAMRSIWKWSILLASSITIFFLVIDISFLSANALKIVDGGWFPLLIAFLIFGCFRIWRNGQRMLRLKLSKFNSDLNEFIENFDREKFCNAKGVAVYMTSDISKTPIALQHNLDHNKVIHERVIILEIRFKSHPTVPSQDRMEITDLGKNFSRVLVNYGYYEEVDINRIIVECRNEGLFENCSDQLTFFLARQTLLNEIGGPFRKMEDSVYLFLRSYSLDATKYFKIPTKNVFEIGMQIKI